MNIDKEYIGQCQHCGYALYKINKKITTRYGYRCIENNEHKIGEIKAELVDEREIVI